MSDRLKGRVRAAGRRVGQRKMMTAAAAMAMARQHRTPEDDAVSRITKDVSDLVSQASVEGKFHESYILPAVLSGVPSYDIRVVHSRIIKGLRRAGYKISINGAQIVINWNNEPEEDDQIRVVYSTSKKKKIGALKKTGFKKRSHKKNVKFS